MKIQMYSISAMIAVFLFNANVKAGPVEWLILQITQGKPAEYICRKARFFDFKFSIRSGKGVACQNRLVAAFAETTCAPKDIESYSKSDCHKNAKKALGDDKPEKVLQQELANLGSFAINMVCTASTKLPVISTVCSFVAKPSEKSVEEKPITTVKEEAQLAEVKPTPITEPVMPEEEKAKPEEVEPKPDPGREMPQQEKAIEEEQSEADM